MADKRGEQAAVRAYISGETVDPKIIEDIIDLLRQYFDPAVRTALAVFLKYSENPRDQTQQSHALRVLRNISDALNDKFNIHREQTNNEKFAKLVWENIGKLTAITPQPTADYPLFLKMLADAVGKSSVRADAATKCAVDVHQAVIDVLKKNGWPDDERNQWIEGTINSMETALWILKCEYPQ